MTGRKVRKSKREKDEGPLFIKDEEFQDNLVVQKAYKKGLAEGRVDGPYKCPVCGMRFFNKWEADDCCRITED